MMELKNDARSWGWHTQREYERMWEVFLLEGRVVTGLRMGDVLFYLLFFVYFLLSLFETWGFNGKQRPHRSITSFFFFYNCFLFSSFFWKMSKVFKAGLFLVIEY